MQSGTKMRTGGVGVFAFARTAIFSSVFVHAFAFATPPSISLSEWQALAAKWGAVSRVVGPPSNAEQVRALASRPLRKLRDLTARLTSETPKAHGVQFIEKLDAVLWELSESVNRLQLLQSHVSEGPLRQLANRTLRRLQNAEFAMSLNPVLYRRLKEVTEGVALDPEQQRLADVLRSNFLFDSKRLEKVVEGWEVEALFDQIGKVEAEFSNGIYSETEVPLSDEELAGIAQADRERLKEVDGKRIANLMEPWQYDLFSFRANHPRTLERIWRAYQVPAEPENRGRAELISKGRARLSSRLGHSNWSVYAAHDTSTSVRSLLAQFESFRRKSERAFRKEKKELEALLGRKPQIWDINRAVQLKREQLGLGVADVREYFPLEGVLEKLFAYFESVLGVRVARVEGEVPWEGARLYALSRVETGEPLGLAAFDPHEREGKDPSYFCLPLIGAMEPRKGAAELPFVDLHARFSPPANGKPSLLGFEEVVNLAHEWGHVLHYLGGQRGYFTLGTKGVTPDLVEFPSLLLEAIAKQSAGIQALSGHYETGAPLDPQTAQKIHEGQMVFRVHTLRWLVARAVLDLKVHGSRVDNIWELEREIFSQYYYPLPEGTTYLSSSDHFVGYDGIVWSYPYDTGLVHKKLARMLKTPEGIFNKEEGHHFMKNFVFPGIRPESKALVANTLGRKFHLCSALLEAAGVR